MGPTVGGYLGAAGDLYRGARLAVGVSLLSALLSLGLPKGRWVRKDPDNNKPGGVWRSFEIARRPAVRGLLLVKVVGSVASSMYGTTYPLVLTQNLGLDARTLGFFMSAASIAVAILGAFGMAPLVGAFGPRHLARYGLAARAGLVLLFSVLVGYAADAYGTEQALAHRTTYVCWPRQNPTRHQDDIDVHAGVPRVGVTCARGSHPGDVAHDADDWAGRSRRTGGIIGP